MNMTVDEIRENLAKRAAVFHTGKKGGQKGPFESWIGSVRWRRWNEGVPVDAAGRKMQPVATICLRDLPSCPWVLAGIELITIFMSEDVWDHLAEHDLSPWFEVRTYERAGALLQCDFRSDLMTPWPLAVEPVDEDYPVWCDVPERMLQRILEKERAGEMEYYADVCRRLYGQHKVGGYPVFCQGGVSYGEGYEFALQISSDRKAGFNIVDCGKFYFFYNPEKRDWKIGCEIY